VITTAEEPVEQPMDEPTDAEADSTSEQAAQQQSEASESATQSDTERPAGTPGVLSEREVVATRIKRALDVDPYKPNAPIAGKGLEIITVRPRYSSTIRMSAVPKNPIVLIYFGKDGTVAKAEFLRDRRYVYSSGVTGVDEPLLNAIYQWKAKGKQIDEIEGDDLLEVSIKILFRRERSDGSD
jgi:outer membrane biosynthesis protein TonB